MKRRLTVAVEHWPIAGVFTISRGSKTEAVVVVVTLEAGGRIGRGECVPYVRYGETVEGVVASIEAVRAIVEGGVDRYGLGAAIAEGAARNALDCALIDLEAKTTGRSAASILGMGAPEPVVTAYTLSLGSPETMHQAARAAAGR
ncbi:MAG TPA: dipeptide epimerase, partial [Methylomirabilota bacterium]|nr:dipeptide epimerase [Methylomirabilota bacterium]